MRFLAAELTALGFSVLRGMQVPDDAALFRAELDGLSRRPASWRSLAASGRPPTT